MIFEKFTGYSEQVIVKTARTVNCQQYTVHLVTNGSVL